jgi:sirohydrochlorin ferrochelatase
MSTAAPATLIGVAHGTRAPRGIAEIRRLMDLVGSKRPEVPIELCWLERADPTLADVLARTDGAAVIVPVLLSTGYHVKVDIPTANSGRWPDTIITPPLGPDERISRTVYLRLMQARRAAGDPPDGGAVVLIGAGSSDPEARTELEQVARHLHKWTGAEVAVGQLTEADPFARAQPGAHVANYLLAPGYFDDRLHALATSRVVAEPIGAHPLVADVIVDRYESAQLT